MQQPAQTGEVSIETATVSVNVLMIGTRQMTAGILRQVPLGWWDGEAEVIARYACSLEKCPVAVGPHHHFLWASDDGGLRRSRVPEESPWPNHDRGDEIAEAAHQRDLAEHRARQPGLMQRVEQAPYTYAAGAR